MAFSTVQHISTKIIDFNFLQISTSVKLIPSHISSPSIEILEDCLQNTSNVPNLLKSWYKVGGATMLFKSEMDFCVFGQLLGFNFDFYATIVFG
jgi:hypothetical protein